MIDISNSPDLSMLDAALAYAARGIPVFPCEPCNKEPCGSLVPTDIGTNRKPVIGSGGFKKATTDRDKITEWWSLRPDAMIGVPTGARSGFFVVDLDAPKQVKRGPIGQLTPDGRAAWAELKEQNGGHGPLLDSIQHTVESGKLGYVGTNVDYAKYQEFGTSRIPPRPFLGGAVEHKGQEAAECFGEEVHMKIMGR